MVWRGRATRWRTAVAKPSQQPRMQRVRVPRTSGVCSPLQTQASETATAGRPPARQ